MKKMLRRMTALGATVLLAFAAVGCSGGNEPDIEVNAPPAASNTEDTSTPAPKGDKPLTDDDDLAFALGAALGGEARWEGDTLQVKLAEEQGANGVRAFTKCKAVELLIEETQTAVLEFTDGSVACDEVLAAIK